MPKKDQNKRYNIETKNNKFFVTNYKNKKSLKNWQKFCILLAFIFLTICAIIALVFVIVKW